jgi:hypothetical protein
MAERRAKEAAEQGHPAAGLTAGAGRQGPFRARRSVHLASCPYATLQRNWG